MIWLADLLVFVLGLVAIYALTLLAFALIGPVL